MNLARKSDRIDLAARREPYWQQIDKGAYLGFRRGPDTWIARYRNRDGAQAYHALAVPADGDPYPQAKALAGAWFAQMGNALLATAKRSTVAQALAAYCDDLEANGRSESAKVSRARFRMIFEGDPLADAKLEDCTRQDFIDWRARLRKGRQVQSVNRYTGAVAAALNRALELGHVGDARTWTLKMLTDDTQHDEATAVFLTPPQRKHIIAAARPCAAEFFKALELTGARPGELARATVADFDGEQLRLADRKGRPPRLRVRYTVLSDAGAAFFARMCRDKLPAARIFVRENGAPWNRCAWGEAFRAAVEKHHDDCGPKERLPDGVSAYAFRHSRISELLQIHAIDPLTVALQTGTGLAQIEKHYYKFIPAALKAKLSAVREYA